MRIFLRPSFLLTFLLFLAFFPSLAQQEEIDYNDANQINNALRTDPSQVDYSKIDYSNPDLDYGILDYTQVDYSLVDHGRVDASKYLTDMKCMGCSFERRGSNADYSRDGLIHPISGLTRVQDLPSGTQMEGLERIIQIRLPKSAEITVLSTAQFENGRILIPSEGSTHLLSVGDQPILHASGAISLSKGRIFIEEGQKATIGGMEIYGRRGDVSFHQDHETRMGNYISLTEDKLIAEGEGYSISFKEEGQSFFKMNQKDFVPDKDNPVAGQNDHLLFSLGDGSGERGKIEIEQLPNSPSLVRFLGSGRMTNGQIPLSISNGQSFVEIRSDGGEPTEGSVPLYLTSDLPLYIAFGESNNMQSLDQDAFDRQIRLRKEIGGLYDMGLEGYFSSEELSLFKKTLEEMEGSLGIAISKMKITSTFEGIESQYALKIAEADSRNLDLTLAQNVLGTIYWNLRSQQEEGVLYLGSTPPKELPLEDKIETFKHEFGHNLEELSPSATEKFLHAVEGWGIEVENAGGRGIKSINPASIPSSLDGVFPTEYSKKTINEFFAETFVKLIDDPEWFTDPSISSELRQKREELRLILIGGLESFQK